jgi:TPR repeat protein
VCLRPFPTRRADPEILRLRVESLLALRHERRAVRVARVLVDATRHAEDWLRLDSALVLAGQRRAAEGARVAALRADPSCVEALRRIALAAAAENRFSAARRTLERAIAYAPRHAELIATLGTLQRRAGQLPAARRTLRLALRLGAGEEAALELAGVCRRLRRLCEAETRLRATIAENPKSALAHADLGDLLACEGGDEREAARCFERAWRLDSENPDVRLLVARAAWRRGANAEAQALLLPGARAGHPASQLDFGSLGLESPRARERLRASRWLARAAQAGNADAAFVLAVELEAGDRIPPDSSGAVACYARAAALNHAPAQVRLAQLYSSSQGVRRDFARASRWYERAAEQGETEAACALGELYDHGLGYEPDPAAAAVWYARAAAHGHSRAQFNLGVLHDTGELGERDIEAALRWLRRSARHGCASAEFYLGMLFAMGDGVEKDDRQAVRWLQRAAEREHAPAQYQLALLLLQGRGGFDDSVAAGWLERAAELELAEAQHLLGFLFRDGRGVPADRHRAYWWFSLAAHQDYPPGQVSLGILLLRGEGARCDPAAAARWFQRAAEAGDAGGQRRLGHCYALGLGIGCDPSEALKWLTLAGEAGDTEAAQLRDSLAPTLSARARFEGRVRAHAYAMERDFEITSEIDH